MFYSHILNTFDKEDMIWDFGCILEMQNSLLSTHVQTRCVFNVEHIFLEHMKMHAVETWHNLVSSCSMI